MLKLRKSVERSFILSIANILVFLALFNVSGITRDIESKVDEYINAHIKMGNFSGSILIAQGGKILISKGYGMANLEHDVPNTPKTKFRLGSVTKQFTAMAVMQLSEQGLLNVNQTLSKFIPDYPDGEKITIHHLLTHTSGIPNITGIPEIENIKKFRTPVEKTIAIFKNKPLEFSPGEKFEYSNSGYVLLGYIIEKVSGKSYEEYVKEKIFTPLNMKDSGYDHHSAVIKHRAAGYSLGENGVVNAEFIDMSVPQGGGGLYSTVEDLYRWDRALYTEKLVKKNSLKKIFSPFKNNYGYGWSISKKFNRKRLRHGGGIEGFAAYITRYIEDDACIIVLSNFQHARVNDISRDLAAILFGEKYEIPSERKIVKLETGICDAIVGVYEFGPGNILNITRDNNRLFIAPPGQPKVEIFPESETKFFLKAFAAEITFIMNEKGEVTKLIFHVGGKDNPAKKIK